MYIWHVFVRQQFEALCTDSRKGWAVLIDPDHLKSDDVERFMGRIALLDPNFIFIGGSLITAAGFEETAAAVKRHCSCPLVLFPGSPTQLTPHVDALLLLSLLSGRNPELLIGHHVVAAPRIRELGLEPIATGYLLIDGGKPTTASYISGTSPIPRDKPEIAAATAMAAEQLGFHCIYLDSGSGADLPVPSTTIEAVRSAVQLPLIVGGGIRTLEQREAAHTAGADLVVMGTVFEKP